MNKLIDRTIRDLHRGIYYKYLGLVVSRQQKIGTEVSRLIAKELVKEKVITREELKKLLEDE